MRIAVSGKGGSGKTTIAATLARTFARQGHRVIAVDGDPNPNLGTALGIPQRSLANIRPLTSPILIERISDSGDRQVALAMPLEEILRDYAAVGPDGLALLLTTKVDHAGAGWLCGAHATVRGMMGQLLASARQMCVLDMEASLEHLSRGTAANVDVLLTVLEPYYRSLETAGRIIPLARELGLHSVYGVANKVRDAQDDAAVRQYCDRHEIRLVASIPFDEAIVDADRSGISLVDSTAHSPALDAIVGLAGFLEDHGGAR